MPGPAAAVVAVAPPAPPPQARFAFDVSAFAGATTATADGLLAWLVGASIGATRVFDRARLGLRVDGELRRTEQVQTADANVSIGGAALHVSAQAGRRFGRLGVGSVLLGAGVALASVDPSAQTPANGTSSVMPRHDWDLDLVTAARWDVPFGAGLSLFVQAAGAVAPTTERYTALVDGGRQVVLTPPVVRPLFLGGIAWAIGE
jgi:hypothetical protein